MSITVKVLGGNQNRFVTLITEDVDPETPLSDHMSNPLLWKDGPSPIEVGCKYAVVINARVVADITLKEWGAINPGALQLIKGSGENYTFIAKEAPVEEDAPSTSEVEPIDPIEAAIQVLKDAGATGIVQIGGKFYDLSA